MFHNYYLKYQNEKNEITVGSFYEQFGNGLIFRAWEDRQLGINNSIMGINYKYYPSANLEFSITQSKHSNKHFRPDIIDSRFLEAIKGFGGPNGNETWNLFNSSQNSLELINYVKGAEISKREARLNVIELILYILYVILV